MARMNTLGTDELILIMIQMKTKYEREYQLLDRKLRATEKLMTHACWDGLETSLKHNEECSVCGDVCFLGQMIDVGVDFDGGDCYRLVRNYVECCGCKKVCCDECWQLKEDGRGDGFVIEHRPNPQPNVWRCKTCNEFHEKMKTLK